eukprot:3062394-Prymnesium_polylepis.1
MSRMLARDGVQWLLLPEVAGGSNANADDASFYSMPLILSASGLRERAAPYEEILAIHVRSAVAAASETQLLEVALTVQAQTSFAVWGGSVGNSRCDGTQKEAAPLRLR